MNNIKKFLLSELKHGLTKNNSMIETLLKTCNSYYEKPVHNLQDMKMRNNKLKGDIFEYFTQLYLKDIYRLKEIWLLNEIPLELMNKLNLKKKDYGIDLVGIDNNDKIYAIQSKFRKHNNHRKTSISWKELSTFYALCERSGPYDNYIVFTTADYVNRIGKKTEKDITIGYNKLSKLTHFEWLKICGDIDITNKEVDTKVLSNEELRNKRLEYYT